LRSLLLDTYVTPDRGSAQPATVVRVQIQPRDLVPRRQHGGQLQLCVPQVAINGPSYRLKNRLAAETTVASATA